mmetsp:Transcript_76018/g.176361  ORF Transcript_76018/g.176361 Transcript_76018/m.176361 type:complete len:124 (+) Transcript_76018:75-446(+)
MMVYLLLVCCSYICYSQCSSGCRCCSSGFFHASPSSNRESIRMLGLRASDGGTLGSGVYCVFNESEAHTIGRTRFGSRYDVWRVDDVQSFRTGRHSAWAGLGTFTEAVVDQSYTGRPTLVHAS